MKNYFFAIVYCLLLISISSCKEIQPVTIGGVENPKFVKLAREGIELEFDMKINNPNSAGVTVFPSDFDATVNGISIGKINLSKKVRIKAKSDNTSTFHIKSDFSKLGLIDVAKLMPIINSKSATIYMKGEVKVGKWFYKKKFPIELKKTISLSK